MPLWNTGYEKSAVRECFRIPTAKKSNENSQGFSYLDNITFPNDEFKTLCINLNIKLKELVDHCLKLACKVEPTGDFIDDLSVMHSFRYPNETKGSFKTQTKELLVKEHIDKSMFVAEFVPNIEGLEIFDTFYNKWLKVNDHFKSCKQIIIFAGKQCEQFDIKPCLHRVCVTPGISRFCVLFEQKYLSTQKLKNKIKSIEIQEQSINLQLYLTLSQN